MADTPNNDNYILFPAGTSDSDLLAMARGEKPIPEDAVRVSEKPEDAEVVEAEVIAPDPDATELGRRDRPGRPTLMTPEVIGKLIAAFNNGFSITEAVQYAGIHRDTYYDWKAKDDFFSYKMSEAQAAVGRRAKQVVAQAINSGDLNTAKWYLARKDPEFSSKLAVRPDNPDDNKREDSLKEFMDDTDDGAYSDATDDVSAESSTPAITEGGSEVAQSPPDIQD